MKVAKGRFPESWAYFLYAHVNSLTAAIRGYGYKLFVKWRRYLGARLERYLQNGAVIRGPTRTLPAK